ncbi:hydrogenase 4 subunit B [Streptomyces pluripotens]|uniref:Hydrogenase 4 subunit B n=1 Tax=Streptomyces pluripotens TaxID=1355015 RepID=A0A221NZ79_9ACTN|nr:MULTISPECIES: proton-conducting transporter membrane subunit [Streptomyces]ARP71049.1 hydrogenase 4 subunit B [Streptomyces pluripotens]ASN25299.1 hydrogenase 4 subunit B [Streptomyces pluripotens]KIE25936.1 NADH-ubiquinone oxidoreductase [Streptomyces sp. MUSC 125]MCH0557181.1 hydrogenase 4 subunit B [Streptomyces sp. MUM 16J]
MNVVPAALTTAAALGGAGVLAGLVLPYRTRIPVVGALTAGAGVSGGAAGVAALGGDRWTAAFPTVLPLAGTHLAVDALAGLFMAVAGGVVAAVAVYGIGYAAGHGPHGLGSRGAQTVLPLFALTLILVPVAASVSTFLVLWELMALASLLLVLAEHRGEYLPGEPGRSGGNPSVRQAGVWYAVMTHLGFLLLLTGFAVFAGQAGGESFGALRAGADGIPPTVRGLVFVLVAAGFTSKAGAVPLHAWLPRAHPEAPSPVSALMSAAMVNLGIYGVVRVGFDLLGGGPAWWWLALLAVGVLSAVYGILQAAMAADLKRLLAYSTSENMGVVLTGVGASGLFAAYGDGTLAAVALAASLLHTINHSAFKALLFCAAGSVLRATGERNLDLLGGLRSRMPVTAGLFALAALGAVALPPGNGFISEWLLLQSLINGLQVPGVAPAIVLPVAVALIALSAGLAAAVFVKALGVGFFARPRSDRAAAARESPPLMLAGMGLLAAACAGLALVPGLLGQGLGRAATAAGLPGTGAVTGGGLQVRLAHIPASLSPLWVVAALTAALALAAALPRAYRRRQRRNDARLWDCGGGAPTPRMAYTATSFAEPLQRVFDDVLAPEQDVNITPVRESAYLVERVRFSRAVPDRIEHRLYTPVLTAMAGAGRAARRLAGGSVHLYLGYGFAGLVILLVVLTVGW